MTANLPPIVRSAESLLTAVELAVRTFHRADRYSIGADLRTQARAIVLCAQQAWRRRDVQHQRAQDLVDTIDRFKIELQLAQRIHATRSLGQFEHLARLTTDVGRQAGGWLRQLKQRKPDCQNAAAHAPPQRAKGLGTQVATTVANS